MYRLRIKNSMLIVGSFVTLLALLFIFNTPTSAQYSQPSAVDVTCGTWMRDTICYLGNPFNCLLDPFNCPTTGYKCALHIYGLHIYSNAQKIGGYQLDNYYCGGYYPDQCYSSCN